jgi:hypothetical protein
MYVSRYLLIFICILVFIFIGCSDSTSPVTLENNDNSPDSVPIISLSKAGDTFNAIGLMGAYELTINPDEMSADLTSKRYSAIGEDYIVSGMGYFTISPCSDCFKIKSISLTNDGLIRLTFAINHPFDPGDPFSPPSGINRLDLDVFDLAMLVHPVDSTPQPYSLNATSVYTGIIANNAGYTTELAGLISDEAALPFVLVIDDNAAATDTFNKFRMGAEAEFDAVFSIDGNLDFNLYLTMGYGWSAEKSHRLMPKYYNPEFNRKAAWKVEVSAQEQWIDDDDTTPVNVEISVYDWQIGATVYDSPDDFDNAPTDNVYSASEVGSVSVEIPGMNSTLQSVTSATSGTGMPTDPLIFNVPIVNENFLSEGEYIGLVKVADSRSVGDIPPSGNRDFLIDKPDGFSLQYYMMPEYTTYQTFIATVVPGYTGYCWTKTWGGTNIDYPYSVACDQSGYIYVTGHFRGTVEFNPDGGGSQSSHGSLTDIFLSKFDSSGIWQWTQTWGGEDYEMVYSVALDQSENVYVTGHFRGAVEFNPDGGGIQTSLGIYDVFLSKFDSDGNWQWSKTWGGEDDDIGLSVVCDQSDNVYITGQFSKTVDFNPEGGGTETTYALYSNDVFLSKFDSSGNWQWVKTWGGPRQDNGNSITCDQSGNLYVTGFFRNTAEFNPDGGDPHTSLGNTEVFLSKFDSTGLWQWAKTWGGTSFDEGLSVACDQSGDIYVTGRFGNTVEFNPDGGGSETTNGAHDAYLSKFEPSGNWQWTKTWGSTGWDWATSVVCNQSDGNVYVTGFFSDTVEFNPDGGGSETSNGNYDAFFSKFDSAGLWQLSKTWGGLLREQPYSITLDQAGSIYITGYYEGTTDFNPDGGDLHTTNGNWDVFLSKMNY